MALQLGALRAALMKPGDAALADKAAEEVAGYDNRLAGIDAKLADLRSEMRAGFASVRGEMSDLRGEMRAEFGSVRGEMSDLRGEMRAELASVRGELRTEIAGVRGEIAGVRGEIGQLRWMLASLIAVNVTAIASVLGVLLKPFAR